MDNRHGSNQAKDSIKDDNAKQAQKAAVTVPLFISLVFFASELTILIATKVQQGGISSLFQYLNYDALLKVVYLFINYFAPTLISMIIFMCVQQFYYKVSAGLARRRVLLLAAVTFIDFFLYVMHIATRASLDFIGWLLFILTCVAIPALWRSLRRDVRWSGRRHDVFSGPGSSSKKKKKK